MPSRNIITLAVFSTALAMSLALGGCGGSHESGSADGGLGDAGQGNDGGGKTYPLPFAVPLHTEGRWIVDAKGQNVILKGFNWNGGEGPDMVMNGLDKGDVRAIARSLAKYGMNSVRLVWSNELVEKNPVIAAERLAANPALIGKTALEVMDAVVDALASEGILVIMNNHISDAMWCCTLGDDNELWYNDRFPEKAWIKDWKSMARRYADNPAVIGADIRNEPRLPACWGDVMGTENDWASAAERGGEAVLSAAPHWLIIVEGLAFGRVLDQVPVRPVQLSVLGRLVYSSHDYPWSQRKGSDISVSSYEELRDSCDGYWGFLLEEGKPYTAPVWLGEFGTCHDCWKNGKDSEKLWFQSVTRYIRERQVGWSWWSLNGNDAMGCVDPATGEQFSPGLIEALMELTAPAVTR